MDNGLAMTKTFQEKMYEKIKEQIGELLSEEDLKKLVDAAVYKAFFEPHTIRDGYGSHVRTEEPPIIFQIKELLRDQVRTAVDQWLKANPDAVTKAIDTTIAKGFHALVEQHVESKIQNALWNFGEQLKTSGLR